MPQAGITPGTVKFFAKVILTVAIAILFLWVVFSWFEANKEIKILCSIFDPDNDLESVKKILETGEYLTYSVTAIGNSQNIEVTSNYSFRSSGCTVSFLDGRFVSATYSQQMQLQKVAAWFAAILFSGMFVFQALLAFGAPLGKFAWGGQHKQLPTKLRVASFFSAGLFVFGKICILERADILTLLDSSSFVYTAAWVLVLLFALSTTGNLLSKSDLEKRFMTPIALALCVTCIIVALGP